MLQKTKGIVLNHFKYTDSSIIAHIYTELYGRQSYIIHGVHSKKSKQKIQFFQPLFLLEMEVYYKTGRELQKIKEISHVPYLTIPYHIGKSSIMLFLAEILQKSLKEEVSNSSLFNFLLHSFQLLDHIEAGIGNFHLLFLTQFSKFLGFHPTNNFSNNSLYFDLMNGGFSQNPAVHQHIIPAGPSLLLHNLLNCSFDNLNQVDFSNKNRSELLDYLVDYYKLHLEGLGEIKSLKVLKEVFK